MCDVHNNQILHMKKIQAEGLELFIRKNADYGDSYKQYGLIGVLVRLQDKINRCLNITKNGISVKDESLRDTLIDLHNYAAMALMESDQNPRVPNLPVRTYSSDPPSSEGSKDLPITDSLSATERACIDQCINLK